MKRSRQSAPCPGLATHSSGTTCIFFHEAALPSTYVPPEHHKVGSTCAPSSRAQPPGGLPARASQGSPCEPHLKTQSTKYRLPQGSAPRRGPPVAARPVSLRLHQPRREGSSHAAFACRGRAQTRTPTRTQSTSAPTRFPPSPALTRSRDLPAQGSPQEHRPQQTSPRAFAPRGGPVLGVAFGGTGKPGATAAHRPGCALTVHAGL